MNPDQRPRLLGILVTFRRPKELSDVLAALAAQDRGLDHLVVIDNDPTPENEEIVRHSYFGHRVEYIRSPENLGPAGGIALGMSRLLEFAEDADWIVTVDDDEPPFSTTLLSNLKRFGEAMLAEDPLTAGVGLVGARFDWIRGRLIKMSGIAKGGLDEAVPVDYLEGARFPFYKVAAVRSVGPFLSDLFFGFEELEYGFRLRDAGFSLYAHGALWREARQADRRLGLDARPSIQLSDFRWRRYYEVRNILYVLRSHGRTGTALRILLIRGIGKPLGNLVINPRKAIKHLRMNLQASRDAWTGRMGRTLEPDAVHVKP